MNDHITILRPSDFHLHVRQGEILKAVLPETARIFQRAIIMPNTNPPILTGEQAQKYKEEILEVLNSQKITGFEPLMTISITSKTTPEIIFDAKKRGVIAGKVYPKGMTTNSDHGVKDFLRLKPVYLAMQDAGMILSLHGESPEPNVFCLDREKKFLEDLPWIYEYFPNLKIVLEHISTKDAFSMVAGGPENLAATITVHHLMLTLNDVIGGKLQPHHFCKPIAKRPEDRMALIMAATSGNPKFFLGTDSAPHLKATKECSCGCAGVYTAPVAIQLLAQIFEWHGKLDKLEGFASRLGPAFYGLPQPTETIRIDKQDWIVPQDYSGIVPFKAGEKLEWQVEV